MKVGRTSIPPRAVGPAAGAPRALAGTRVARVAGEAGPGEPESPLDPFDEAMPPEEDEAMSLRATLLTIAGVAVTVVALLAVVIFGLRLINAGAGPDDNVKVPPITSLTLAEAIPIAEQLGLRIKVTERVTSESLPVDTILSQSPDPSTLVPLDSVIEVRVVAGSGLAWCPICSAQPRRRRHGNFAPPTFGSARSSRPGRLTHRWGACCSRTPERDFRLRTGAVSTSSYRSDLNRRPDRAPPLRALRILRFRCCAASPSARRR